MAALGHASETPERLWNMSMAMTTADELAALAASARRSQVLLPIFLMSFLGLSLFFFISLYLHHFVNLSPPQH